VAQLCVNTLLATKVTLITDGIYFGRLRANINVVPIPTEYVESYLYALMFGLFAIEAETQ
jgi:hypothetical protein